MHGSIWIKQGQAEMGAPLCRAEEWFAIRTRSRYEKRVSERLCEKGMTFFLPVVRKTHRWTDRTKIVELPLFHSYLFVRFTPSNDQRLRVLQIDGVLEILGSQGMGTPIPSEQIDAVRILVEAQVPYEPHPFLKMGDKVRVRGGALDGLQGVLLSGTNDRKLIVSVDAMGRSLAIQLEGCQLEGLKDDMASEHRGSYEN